MPMTPQQHDQENGLPIAVIGAGPVGLAAAAHLVKEGLTPMILEAGTSVGASISQWGHVRLFSPWRYNIDAAAAELLSAEGWSAPTLDDLPQGQELVRGYLEPLANTFALRDNIRTSTAVLNVAREGLDKVHHDRANTPFVLRVQTAEGADEVRAAAVIDASGTWRTPNPLGGNGTTALGEAEVRHHLVYGMPNISSDEERFHGKKIAVVGSGHSAANIILDLLALQDRAPRTQVHWVVRGDTPRAYGGGAADELPARGALGLGTRGAVETGRVHLHQFFSVSRVTRSGGGDFTLESANGSTLAGLDEVIVATGQRPDLSLTSELRLDLDLGLDSARNLGPLIDPNIHSCGTVRPHSYVHLAHPEPDYFIVGAKSYGRAPTFLLATGYEQVRSVAAHLAGDEQRARATSFVLPESGVCGTDSSTGCCASPSDETPAAIASGSSCCD